MSSIKLTADSGGGTFEIKAPSSGSNARVLTIPDESATLLTSATSTGKILQVVSTTVTSASQVTMSADDEDTLLSRTYTPTVSSSNALVQFSMHLDIDGSYGGMYINVLRDSTILAIGDAAGNRSRCTVAADFSNTGYGGALHSFSILDTGISGTSQVTYKVNILDKHSSGGTYYFNMGRDTSNNSYILRPVSTITVMEVAA